MAASLHSVEADSRRAVAAFISAVVRIGFKAMAKTHSVLLTVQTARMMSVLSNMSDHQLDQIGISRADIPKYAETLMAED